MAQVTITINPRAVERFIYWLVIVILLVLLILCYLNDTEPEQSAEAAADNAAAAAAGAIDDVEDTVEEVLETCSDEVKNQDETDVDCGGTCPGCQSGYSCDTAADCAGDYCVDGKCTNEEPVELSGDVDLEVTGVVTSEPVESGALKVTEVSYELTNGLDEDLDILLFRVYLKSKRDASYCLNQLESEEFECPNPYAQWTLSGPDSGETLTNTIDLDGNYLGASYVQNYGSTQYYDHGDEFSLFIYVYDELGNPIDGGTSAFTNVIP